MAWRNFFPQTPTGFRARRVMPIFAAIALLLLLLVLLQRLYLGI